MMRVAGFANWLEAQGYRPGTIRKAVADVELLRRRYQPESPVRVADMRRAHALYQSFARFEGVPLLDVQPPSQIARPAQLGPRKARAPRRQKEAVSFDDAAFRALRAAVKADRRPAAAVLEVMCETGLRVGDVLRVRQADLAAALGRADGLLTLEVKGGRPVKHSIRSAPEAWLRLAKVLTRHPNAADAVCPGYPNPEADGAAYKAVARMLKQLGTALGLQGRIHLHRTRRTVAVNTLAAGVPLDVVKEILGQADVRTTARYTDEGIALKAAEALRRSRGTTP